MVELKTVQRSDESAQRQPMVTVPEINRQSPSQEEGW